MSLLSGAKKVKSVRLPTMFNKGGLELIEGWLSGEISLKQVSTVKKFRSSAAAYLFIARGARIIWMNNIGVKK